MAQAVSRGAGYGVSGAASGIDYPPTCAAFGAAAGFVLYRLGVPTLHALLVDLVGVALVALLMVLVAALSGRR